MYNKSETFKKAVIEFKNSKQTSKDYYDFLVTSIIVSRSGDGLVYTQLDEILKEVIDKEKEEK